MFAEEVENILTEFQATFSNLLECSPFYLLDNTWQSLNTIELILSPFFGQSQDETEKDLNKASDTEIFVVRGAASYIAHMAYFAWKEIGADPLVELTSRGIQISTTSGPGISLNEKVEIFIEENLRSFLRSLPNPFPVIREFRRQITAEVSFINLYAFGVVSGLSPFGNGPWKNLSLENAGQNITQAAKTIANGLAFFYARVFPNEQLGQIPELYLNNLIFPPELMSGSFTAEKSTQGLIEFFANYNVSSEKALKLTSNLALIGDEIISNAGIVYTAALSDKIVSPQFIATCKIKGLRAGLLRNAVHSVRQNYNLSMDWIFADLKDGSYNPARIEMELTLGFYPWIKISPNILEDEKRRNNGKFFGLLAATALFDLENAKKILKDYIEESPNDLQLRTQGMYLELISGNPELALQIGKQILTEPGAEKEAQLYNILGITSFSIQNFKNALVYFTKAYQLRASASFFADEISTNYGWSLFMSGNNKDALKILKEVSTKNPCPLQAMLNMAFIYSSTGDEQALLEVEEDLLKLAPLHPAVFLGTVYGEYAT